jgi:hypothetical protein
LRSNLIITLSLYVLCSRKLIFKSEKEKQKKVFSNILNMRNIPKMK